MFRRNPEIESGNRSRSPGLAKAEAALGPALEATTRGGGPPREDDASVIASPMSQLTRTGAVMGTPMFMAPEQHRGDRADARSDQFAFCVSLYHALYGAWPYEGKTAPALADAVIAGRLAPAPKGASVSTRLRKILLRGLATDPLQRYPAMQDLLADLEHDAKPRAKSRLPLWLGAALVVIAAGGAGTFRQSGWRAGCRAELGPRARSIAPILIGRPDAAASWSGSGHISPRYWPQSLTPEYTCGAFPSYERPCGARSTRSQETTAAASAY
jgi:hypothetical protein